MAPFDRSCTNYYWCASVIIALSCTIFELFDVKQYRDLDSWVKGHRISLKMVPFESLGTVSYSHFIATMAVSLAVSEIFSDK